MRFIIMLALIFTFLPKAQALNLHELYVTSYDIPEEHESEIEWLSSLSSANILRSSIELSHGFSKNIGAGIYVDFTREQYGKFENSAWRAYVKTKLYNSDVNALNLSAAIEVELPQDDDETLAVEAKLIADKKFDRWQFTVTPTYEYVRLRVRNQDGNDVEYESGLDAGVKYHHSDERASTLTYKSELNSEKQSVFLLGTEFEAYHDVEFSFGLGVTSNQENLVKFGIETEL